RNVTGVQTCALPICAVLRVLDDAYNLKLKLRKPAEIEAPPNRAAVVEEVSCHRFVYNGRALHSFPLRRLHFFSALLINGHRSPRSEERRVGIECMFG